MYKSNPPQGKRWWLYIFPEYLANQTKPIEHIERYGLMAIIPMITTLLVEFEWLTIFLCVFMRSFRVFMRKALSENVPVKLFFLTVDWTQMSLMLEA